MNAQQQTLVKVAQRMDQLARKYSETEEEKKSEIIEMCNEADNLLIELLRAFSMEQRVLVEAIIRDYQTIEWPMD